MATYAVLSGDIVANVIVADSQEIAEAVTNSVCVEFTDSNPAGIGMIFDAEKKSFHFPIEIPETQE